MMTLARSVLRTQPDRLVSVNLRPGTGEWKVQAESSVEISPARRRNARPAEIFLISSMAYVQFLKMESFSGLSRRGLAYHAGNLLGRSGKLSFQIVDTQLRFCQLLQFGTLAP